MIYERYTVQGRTYEPVGVVCKERERVLHILEPTRFMWVYLYTMTE